MCWSRSHKKGGTPAAVMRRSPPGLSCLMGLDLQRKRPLADLTPEAPAPAPEARARAEPPPPPVKAAGDMTLAVEETPSFEHTTRSHDNPNETRKR